MDLRAGRLALQLGLERRREAGPDIGGPDPRLEACRLAVDRLRRLRRDVLEESQADLAARAPRPAADDPPVGPDGRAGVTVAIEERRSVRTQIPVAVAPAHRRR